MDEFIDIDELLKRVQTLAITPDIRKGLKVSHDPEWEKFVAQINGQSVSTVEICLDDEGMPWFSGLDTDDAFRRKGLGSLLVAAAVEKWEKIYISTHPKGVNDGDTRYLTMDGAALINACIDKGIVDRDWYADPTNTYSEPDFE